MRKVFLGLLLFFAFAAVAQQKFNNEWIDYQKTYYKFKVGSDGLYRIPAATVAAAGLNVVAAENFQLWRNGVEVPIYTSKASGPLTSSDYIEFWGQMNDGKADKAMYRDPAFHLNDRWSLLTDTAAYFLTVNTTGNNLRLQPTANDVAGNTLPAEPYFLYKAAKYYRDMINRGLYYLVASDHLFSSSYDRGEGWTSVEIERSKTLTENFTNLYPATSGPAAKINVALTGNAYNSRRYKITVNGDSVLGNLLPYMNVAVEEASFSTSLLSASSTPVVVTNNTDACGSSSCPADKMVVHKLEITYPREFNFGNATNFEFTLSASAAGAYLEITNFNHGGIAPVLYDLTNGKRYDAQLSGSLVKVVLQPSATPRNLVLVSQATTNIATVSALQTRQFIDYNAASNQGDYLIISNSVLFNGANGTNPVEEYRAYRASTQGGGFNAKIYLEDELCDQFAFGIKKHPLGVRNFILYAQNNYPVPPRNVFLIGRGVNYVHQRTYESSATKSIRDNLENLNLVPTFGFPASDMLLGADLSTSKPLIPIGRLTAITPTEVATYLKKVKEYELAQRSLSPSIQDKAWMKNIGHIIGAGDDVLDDVLFQYMESYRTKAEDTLYGAKVTTFRKASTNAVEQLNSEDLKRLINNGVSVLTYYGHSSATTLEFNLDEPANYNNVGKYPMFFALGCNAGNTFDFQESRFVQRNYLSDKYVLAPDRGSINFVASTHFGVVHYLDIWNSRAYANFSKELYGRSIGEVMKKTIHDMYGYTTTNDFFARCNAEETVLNGDPAIKLNQQVKPDYVITDDMVSVSPSFVSVADQSFRVKIRISNLGKAVNQKIVVETKRRFPSGATEVIRRDTIPGTRYMDSLSFNVGIDPITDKGTNKILVTVDADNTVDELFETNNSGSCEFEVYEEEARPVYPYAFGIVNQPNVTLVASSANPFSPQKQYRMEMDTTEQFNSSVKVGKTVSTSGGLIEFDPGVTLTNGTVYYWRVSPETSNGQYNWNTSSFIYLANSQPGYNQSHIFQHLKSSEQNMILDSASREWSFQKQQHSLFVRNPVFLYGTVAEGDLTVSVDGDPYIRSACVGRSLIFNVFDQKTFKPWKNVDANGKNLFAYGSGSANCQPSRNWNFEFSYMTQANRKLMMDFMDSIPVGAFVVVRSMDIDATNSISPTWRADTALYGSNNSLYHKLLAAGLAGIDSLSSPRPWILIYQKGVSDFQPRYTIGANLYDRITASAEVQSFGNQGYIISPVFGPAKSWQELQWNGHQIESQAGDKPQVSVLGVRNTGSADTLFRNIIPGQNTVDISSINAQQYPYVQLVMNNLDSTNNTPYQLGYWRVTGVPVPEGAIAPNLFYQKKDTVDIAEPLDIKLAFKNITTTAFDSLKVKMVVTDRNNVQHVIPVQRHRPLPGNDTVIVRASIDSRQLVGNNTLFVEVNPDKDQPEQYSFNNFAYTTFYVRPDTLNPLLDVTFDNIHILNHDIVAAKPNITIRLKDEAKWFALTDTATVKVQVRFPNGTIRSYRYDNDTLQFTPAQSGPNNSNTATVSLKPYFVEDGTYELIVTGKDMSSNQAGTISYRVAFQVINKAMISNMLNYPNPFTTSTAFVFTITGSEVPQNIRIQILTVTGKIVREITKEELGPLRVGRNITEYKWDGTDQYGQKLGNGVYLYRVITNLNGKSLDKYTAPDESTDKYFNKGYGKMYLMR